MKAFALTGIAAVVLALASPTTSVAFAEGKAPAPNPACCAKCEGDCKCKKCKCPTAECKCDPCKCGK